ncbi:MAG: hypothetical protein AAGI44_01815 [Pseudomonadota bacterium]
MARRMYDVETPLGNYYDKEGRQKTGWQNVGAVIEGDKAYLLLDRWFNPAGPPNPDNRTSFVLFPVETKCYVCAQPFGVTSERS